jgi:hypothetical protein
MNGQHNFVPFSDTQHLFRDDAAGDRLGKVFRTIMD